MNVKAQSENRRITRYSPASRRLFAILFTKTPIRITKFQLRAEVIDYIYFD
jgi:hypothetical protein